jgi:PKD repeat protein
MYHFEAPSNVADFYGTRVRGFLLPAVTGNYTFWIASDDEGILFLSSNENPINIQDVAHVPAWTLPRDWFRYSEQESEPIYLIAGRKYYVEVLHKELNNGENLAVAWRRPDAGINSPPQLITNPYLCPITQIDRPPQAGFTANPYSGDAPLLVGFDASGSFDVDGVIVAYDWRFGDGGEATGELTNHIFTEPGNHQVQLFVTDDDGNVSGSTIQYVTVFGEGFTREDWARMQR